MLVGLYNTIFFTFMEKLAGLRSVAINWLNPNAIICHLPESSEQPYFDEKSSRWVLPPDTNTPAVIFAQCYVKRAERDRETKKIVDELVRKNKSLDDELDKIEEDLREHSKRVAKEAERDEDLVAAVLEMDRAMSEVETKTALFVSSLVPLDRMLQSVPSHNEVRTTVDRSSTSRLRRSNGARGRGRNHGSHGSGYDLQ